MPTKKPEKKDFLTDKHEGEIEDPNSWDWDRAEGAPPERGDTTGIKVIVVVDRPWEDGSAPSDGMRTEPWEQGKRVESRPRSWGLEDLT